VVLQSEMSALLAPPRRASRADPPLEGEEKGAVPDFMRAGLPATLMAKPMAEPRAMNKPSKSYPRPLSALVAPCLGDVFARQGFASGELVTHWAEIVGPEIAALAEPLKLQWPRPVADEPAEPAVLLLRVEGPAAIEVQHLAPQILERVNRYLGWRAVGRVGIRQAPLARAAARKRPPPPDEATTAAIAATLKVDDAPLRTALARLGAVVKGQ
jgi:hypothetical protein